MPRSTPPHPPAQQERSRRTEHQILQAGLALLGELGEAGITMSAVSERAGVSVGSIYRRFGSREDLLIAMTKEFAEGFHHRLQRKLSAARPEDLASPQARIRLATTAVARLFQQNAHALGRLILMGLAEPRIFREGQRASIAGGEDYIRFVLGASEHIRRPDPEAAIDYTYRMIYAVCAQRITQPANLDSRRQLGWDRLVTELVEANIAYLLTPKAEM